MRHLTVIFFVFLFCASPAHALIELSDDQLSGYSGQAVMMMSKQAGTGISSGITFYRAGLDAVLELNTNIQKLQLGCGGANGLGCDIDADNFSLGCIANSSGNCITLSPTGNQIAGSVSDIIANQQQLKDFVITRPYFQFAIKNDSTHTLREIIGVRLGGENASGPMSLGNMKSFSGYMSAKANMTMLGQNDIAVTSPNNFGYPAPSRSLGLADFQACVWVIINICAWASSLTVDYGSGSLTGIPVVASGSRLNQATIQGVNLGNPINQMLSNLRINRSSGLPAGLINIFIGQIRDRARTNIRSQLSNALPCSNIDNCDIPYNLSNVHQINVDSSNFGFSFQKEPVLYPGYVSPMSRGWTMYLPDAFTLNVSRPATEFVNNIVQGHASAGNIIGLEAPYRNCWGTARFC